MALQEYLIETMSNDIVSIDERGGVPFHVYNKQVARHLGANTATNNEGVILEGTLYYDDIYYYYNNTKLTPLGAATKIRADYESSHQQ